MTDEEEKAQKALAARKREQNKLRMRRVKETQRAAKEAEEVFGWLILLFRCAILALAQSDKSLFEEVTICCLMNLEIKIIHQYCCCME